MNFAKFRDNLKRLMKNLNKRALSVNDLLNYRPHSLAFEGKWEASFG